MCSPLLGKQSKIKQNPEYIEQYIGRILALILPEYTSNTICRDLMEKVALKSLLLCHKTLSH
jgi:hypothetical protein